GEGEEEAEEHAAAKPKTEHPERAEHGKAPEHAADATDRPHARDVSVSKKHHTAGAKAYLTMTTHPGAKAYLGITDAGGRRGSHGPQPWNVPPFTREEVPATAHNIAIVPGDGSVVSYDGVEVASIEHLTIEPGEEKLITAFGPTVTFRELHDQLSVK